MGALTTIVCLCLVKIKETENLFIFAEKKFDLEYSFVYICTQPKVYNTYRYR